MSTVAPLLPKAVIIVLNWNGARDTVACAQSLLRLDYPNFQIVLCDNASRLDQQAILLEWGSSLGGQFCSHDSLDAALSAAGPRTQVTLIQTGGNLGYAGGMNIGMRYALADPSVQYCWVLNNDTEVDPAALAELVRRAQSDSRIGLCGSSLVLHHDRGRMQAFGGASYNRWRARSAAIGINAAVADIPADPSAVEAQMAYVIGASMLVSRRYLEEVGLMDETYFLYSEEHDWAERGRARFRLGYASRSLVFHKHGATIGTASSGGSELSLFYLFRNKLAFTRRHTPWLFVPALLSLLWEAGKFLLKRQQPKARAAIKGLLAERKMKSWVG